MVVEWDVAAVANASKFWLEPVQVLLAALVVLVVVLVVVAVHGVGQRIPTPLAGS